MIINANEIPFEATAHGQGLKKVLIRGAESPTMLTQFAFGKLLPGEKVLAHVHQSMEEIFYFLRGEGVYDVDGVGLQISEAAVVRIPAGISHALRATGVTPLEFIYFGIATG